MRPNPSLVANFASDRGAGSSASKRITVNNIFLPDNFLLENVGRIRHIPRSLCRPLRHGVPATFGRRSGACLPEAEYRVIDAAGHSAFEAWNLCRAG